MSRYRQDEVVAVRVLVGRVEGGGLVGQLEYQSVSWCDLGPRFVAVVLWEVLLVGWRRDEHWAESGREGERRGSVELS